MMLVLMISQNETNMQFALLFQVAIITTFLLYTDLYVFGWILAW